MLTTLVSCSPQLLFHILYIMCNLDLYVCLCKEQHKLLLLKPDCAFPVTLLVPGVYFDSCVRQIKFVDFCGKYRLPLMHYLCSPECTSPCSSNPQSDAESEEENSVPADRLQRVLLG